jgi:hypothetical protein
MNLDGIVKEIAQRLRSDSAAIAQRLRIDCASDVQES